MDKTELQNLAKMATVGDQSAYRDLLAESAQIMRRYFLKRGFGEHVEDIVQESLIGIHKSFQTYDCARPYTPWMFAVASYKAASYFRKVGRENKHVTSQGDEVEELFEDAKFAERFELSKDLELAMQELPPKQRLALEYLKIKEYSVSEAAQSMGISESAVKVNAHRAYKALKTAMEKVGYEH